MFDKSSIEENQSHTQNGSSEINLNYVLQTLGQGGEDPDITLLEENDGIQTYLLAHNFETDYVFPDLSERKHIGKYDPKPEMGIKDGDLNIGFHTTAKITFVESNAGYKNTLGHYVIAEDGTIQSAQIAFENAKSQKRGAEYSFAIPGGDVADIGFFIIANGYSKNKQFKKIDLDKGELRFVYDLGGENERLARITDNADDISLIHVHGKKITVLKGDIYHSAGQGASVDLNPDSAVHTVTGLADADDSSVLRVGFEDLKNLGDADFNDLIFDLSIETAIVDVSVDAFDDTLNGTDGNDVLTGGLGHDTIDGNDGDDLLYGGEGDDVMNGGAGNDELQGNSGNDTLSGGEGNDFVAAGSGDDVASGNEGDDIVWGMNGEDTLYGNDGNDILDGGKHDDTLYGGAGNDELRGGTQNDTLYGEDGDDALYGNDDDDTLYGGAGLDLLLGGTGNDTLDGGADNDILWGQDGNDILNGGDGDDLLRGHAGQDRLNGDSGSDTLYGGDDNDTLFGGDGDDFLYGEGGDDLLVGGLGIDKMTGGSGSDTFGIYILDGVADTINDFSLTGPEADKINISEVLTGFDPLSSDINDFVQIRFWNTNRVDIKINADGLGNDYERAFVVYGSDFTGTSVQDLLDAGQLIVDQSLGL